MRVVIAEDNLLLREGISALLRDDSFDVVAAVPDAPQLLSAVAALAPDLAIVDVRMPPTHTDEGLRAALEIRSRWPGVGIVVLSQYVEERYATELLAGDTRRTGYLLKDRVADVSEFIASLRRVAGGGTALDPEVVRQLLARGRARGPLTRLTAREREVLSLIAEGHSNSSIGEVLVVSTGAVQKHVASIFGKLELPPDDRSHRRVLAVLSYLRDAN
ncbi:MAG TPA: response regulator transcription factor [Streptosporangiaceae bacterium]|nr:response regulator transcription factor [Streptosporangiaceae bacterium]